MIWAPTFSNGLVTVIGGSGFVGRYIAQRMAHRGWRVRVACRRPNEALFVQTYGVVGQVLPVQCNIRDEDSTRRVIMGADAVVNCVGVLWEAGRNSFDAVQAEGAGRAARLAAAEGASRFVHISAIGADPDGPSAYGRTKAAGEQAVLEAFPQAIILRPSIVFGPEDEFFNQFAGMTRFTPVLPVVGADTRFQPVWVEDVAEAAARACTGAADPAASPARHLRPRHRRARHLRARRPARGHLPRADAADAEGHPPPARDRQHPLSARAAAGSCCCS